MEHVASHDRSCTGEAGSRGEGFSGQTYWPVARLDPTPIRMGHLRNVIARSRGKTVLVAQENARELELQAKTRHVLATDCLRPGWHQTWITEGQEVADVYREDCR